MVVGAGLVGLATAHAMATRWPDVPVTVIDKELGVARHQSGRNSGVIHSGVYYPPGSAKARLCRRGRELLLDFVRTHDITHDLCGKVVVAVEDHERAGLHAIAERGRANGVDASLVDRAELGRLEPAVRGVEALHVRDAGIVDFVAVAERLATLVRERGGTIRTGETVLGTTERPDGLVVHTTGGDVLADRLVACAGLHSDRLLEAVSGEAPPVSIVPFRGEYHRLRPEARQLCRSLIYPVPDPRFPFLGVHLTRHVSGEVLAGPNAVLAMAREGYTWQDRSLRDLREIATDPGMRSLAAAHWRTGVGEMTRSLSRRAFARALRRMTPDLRVQDLQPYRSGVRAQALYPDGSLADDFVMHRVGRTVHVLNAPSPAATASLAIGAEIAERLVD
ncbi:L-2-hydroxyglutarate oxidase [Euzebya rosea]|uniref:L-2-hydroxyglutarate oxidase n=1 Tax=Euzebya rosea TaxID=2052804 RepID=UPI003B832360